MPIVQPTLTMDFQLAAQSLETIKSSFDEVQGSRLVFDLINGRDTPLGVVQAMIQQNESKDATFERLGRVQSMIIRLATKVPFAQASLVALLEAFHNCSDRDIYMGIWGTFGMNEGDLHSALMHDQERAAQYININSFEAQLWKTMGEGVEDYTMGHPIRIFARSIEQEKPDDGFQTTDAETACACLWAIHTSKGVWHLSKTKDPDGNGKDWRGDLWTGERGYSVERWELWKRRFHDVAEDKVEGVSIETRRLAVAAVANMDGEEALDREHMELLATVPVIKQDEDLHVACKKAEIAIAANTRL